MPPSGLPGPSRRPAVAHSRLPSRLPRSRNRGDVGVDRREVDHETEEVQISSSDITLKLSHTVDSHPITDKLSVQALIPAEALPWLHAVG